MRKKRLFNEHRKYWKELLDTNNITEQGKDRLIDELWWALEETDKAIEEYLSKQGKIEQYDFITRDRLLRLKKALEGKKEGRG